MRRLMGGTEVGKSNGTTELHFSGNHRRVYITFKKLTWSVSYGSNSLFSSPYRLSVMALNLPRISRIIYQT